MSAPEGAVLCVVVRMRWSRIASVVALVATVGVTAAAFRIDPEVRAEVTTPPTGLWIPAPVSGQIVHVDAASGGITARADVGEPGAELELGEADGGVVVVDRTAGRVNLVDTSLNEVARSVEGLVTGASLVDIGPEGVAMASDAELVVTDLELTAATRHVVGSGTRSVVADGEGGQAENGAVRTRVAADGTTTEEPGVGGLLVRVADEVFVAAQDRVETLDGTGMACWERPVFEPSHVVGVEIGWVVAIVGSDVHVADLTNGNCAVTPLLDAEGRLGRPVVAARRVFVPESDTGAVHIVDPSRETSTRHEILPAGDLRLRARADIAVAYDAARPIAAVLDTAGNALLVDTSIGERGIATVLDEDGNAALLDRPAEGTDGAGRPGGEGVSESADAAVLDASLLAASLRDATDEQVLPDDSLVANFAFSASTVEVGEFVRFLDTSTGGPESWMWDFGDGTGAEGPEARKAWDEPGSYPVTLRVTRGEETAEISLAITVVPAESVRPPAADFALSSSVVEVGRAIEFEDRSDGDIDRWRWDFGDGTSATGPAVRKSWGRAGRYEVTLTVANEQGSDSTSVVVEVVDRLEEPEAVVSVSSTEVDLGEPVRFRGASVGGPAGFTWDFGDGRTSTGAEVVHVFLEEGTFTVTLTAANDAGRSTDTVRIVVSPPTRPPVAAIAALPEVIEVGDVVTLTSLSSNKPGALTWNFGDGGSATGERVTHVWETPGTYLVTLTATNDAGTDTVTATAVVLAELPAPVARIGEFDSAPWVGDTTVFIDASIDATAWTWDFGDGVTSNVPDPLHTFTTAGQKVVTLTVTNRNGTDTTSVVVNPRLRPVAGFVASDTAIRAGETVAFTDDSVNAVSWTWNFGDGTTSNARNPMHTFASTGTFDVMLTVRNATGDQDSFGPVTIEVDPAAPRLRDVVKFRPAGDIVTLTTASFAAVVDPASGPIDLYEIDFGDGSAKAQNTTGSFSHTYDERGTYEVSMRARGPLGDFSAAVRSSFTVVDPPPPSVQIADGVANAIVGPMRLEGIARSGSGPIQTWRWSVTRVGGGASANYTGRVATHDFTDPGQYRVQLTAVSPVDAVPDDVKTRTITISVPPPPSITALVASPSVATQGDPDPVVFTPTVTGSVSTWEWDYGNGFVPGGPTGQQIFNSLGTKEVRLRVTGPYGGTATRSVTVQVLPPPDPTTPVPSPGATVAPNTTVSFTSGEANGLTGLTWDWRIIETGASTPTAVYSGVGPSVSHLFTQPGSWTVEVVATDARGVSGTDRVFVTVLEPLVAAFDHTTTLVPFQVAFTDRSTGPGITTWSWNFGNGATSNQRNPSTLYLTGGDYVVTLTVSGGGQTATVTRTITL